MKKLSNTEAELRKSVAYKKKGVAEEELVCIDMNDIVNLDDLSKLVFMDEECWNLKVINNGGNLTRNMNQKTKSDNLQAYRCPL